MLEPIPQNPIVNAGLLYVNGLQMSITSNTVGVKTILVSPGEARDSTNINDIILDESITINGANIGPNGVDVVPIIANNFYAVYIIADSTKKKPTAGLFSLVNNFPPTVPPPFLPLGYDMFRRIGWILTNGSANIVVFYQRGINENRQYYYDIPINIITDNSSTVYLAIAVVEAVPPLVPSEVLLNIVYTPSSASNKVQFALNDSFSNQAGIIQFGCGVAALQTGTISVPTSQLPFQRINCLVNSGDVVTLNAVGYTDYLS